MKFPVNQRQAGSVLLLTLFACMAIGIVLASFLALISARNKITVRSTGWNAAIPVLEAGIEEAMTHLVKDKWTLTANGWNATTIAGQPVLVKKRTLPDGSYYNVTIYEPSSTSPYIYSQGFVPSPLEKDKYISRLVRVQLTNPPSIFSLAIATTGKIVMAGNNGIVDGYDSKLGLYNTVSNRSAVGGLATSSQALNAVDIAGGHVYGTVTTGPGGTISLGTGAIGDVNWNDSGKKGIQPGWTNNNMNVAYPSNFAPTGSFPLLSYGGKLFLGAGTNRIGTVTCNTLNKAIVVTNHATLIVDGDFAISGNGFVDIKPGASLTLFVSGKTSVSGGGIINSTGLPASFSLVATGNGGVKFNGMTDFYGTINAPDSAVTLGGTSEFFGAIIAETFTMAGSAKFHYDKELAKQGEFMVNTWKEL